MSFLPEFFLSNYIYLVLGFVILIKGADTLISGASTIAVKYGISPLVVGLTIVAFGTSAPELFVNVFSAFNGQTDLALGNIIGSNIANTWLVLGIAALIYPLKAKNSTIFKEVPFSLIASFALFFLAYDTYFSGASENIITRGESLVLLLFFIIFFTYTFAIAKNKEGSNDTSLETNISIQRAYIYIVLGLIGLGFGADLLVGSASGIALDFGVSETVIGLTIVAFGTSAAEIVTSVIASLKRQPDLAIGNVVGSNIFNILLVLGITGSVTNLPVGDSIIIDIAIELFAISLLIITLLFIGKRGVLTRGEGALFLALYVGYIGYLLFTQVFI